MRNTIALTLFISITFLATSALSSGYRIPEQSLNSTALSSAYVANAYTADAAYYNPANMSWLKEGTNIEGGFSYIHLPSISYTDNRSFTLNGKSEKENFLIPNFYMVSPDYNNFRFGFALVFPAGLSKRWKDTFPRTFAEEFSMTVVEANPTVSYKFCDKFSAAVGARIVYSKAKTNSQGNVIAIPAGGLGNNTPAGNEYTFISRELEGDTTELGYNLALTFKPLEDITLAATYRSEIDMDMDGDGILYATPSFSEGILPSGFYQGAGSVSVPLPAILALAVAYTYEKATIEFEYDRTYWSAYETLDVNYAGIVWHPVLAAAFDDPARKDWEDVDAFRLGLTYHWNENLTLMAGGGIDGNPIPEATLSFDLPDSDAWFFSFGLRYNLNEQWSFGGAYLYADKEDRTVVNSTINGEFSGASSHLFAMSASYTF